ncbi:ABC transporter permease subunit [Micromonospora sp. M12]
MAQPRPHGRGSDRRRSPGPAAAQLLGRHALLVVSGFPFAFLLTLSYLSGIDPSLEAAAATLGAGWWQRFRSISFRCWYRAWP